MWQYFRPVLQDKKGRHDQSIQAIFSASLRTLVGTPITTSPSDKAEYPQSFYFSLQSGIFISVAGRTLLAGSHQL
jgi:hypothetical protein